MTLSTALVALGLALSIAGMAEATSSHRKSCTYRLYATGSPGTVSSLLFTPPNKLEVTEQTALGHSPSWITFDKHGKQAYVLGTNALVLGLDGLQQKGLSGGYSTGGDGPVASCLVQDCLFVANYGAGSASIMSISPKGLLSAPPAQVFQYTREGVGPVTSRQDHCYAHDATASPDGGWVYICDLGSDEIHHIKVNKHDCAQSTAEVESTKVAIASGPRHLSFHRDSKQDKQFAYLASELSCTLTAFAHDPQTGKLDMIGEPLLSVPEGTPLGGNLTAGPQRTTAEVVISPDGRFVYVSDRGDDVEDHITVFERATDGSICYLDWFPSGGQMPRHFSMSADGKYLAVGHETTGNVVILERDEQTGALVKTGAVLDDLRGTQFAGFFPPQPYV